MYFKSLQDHHTLHLYYCCNCSALLRCTAPLMLGHHMRSVLAQHCILHRQLQNTSPHSASVFTTGPIGTRPHSRKMQDYGGVAPSLLHNMPAQKCKIASNKAAAMNQTGSNDCQTTVVTSTQIPPAKDALCSTTSGIQTAKSAHDWHRVS